MREQVHGQDKMLFRVLCAAIKKKHLGNMNPRGKKKKTNYATGVIGCSFCRSMFLWFSLWTLLQQKVGCISVLKKKNTWRKIVGPATGAKLLLFLLLLLPINYECWRKVIRICTTPTFLYQPHKNTMYIWNFIYSIPKILRITSFQNNSS